MSLKERPEEGALDFVEALEVLIFVTPGERIRPRVNVCVLLREGTCQHLHRQNMFL